MIICVAANPSIDKTFEVERIVPGAIHRPLAFTQVAGSKAINQARGAAALGAEVELVVLAGGHTGRWVAEQLEAEGIETAIVQASSETRSSLSVLDRSCDHLTEFYEAGARISAGEWAAFEQAVTARISPGDWLSIAGSLPPGAPPDGYARILRAGRAAGAETALDTAGEALRLGLEERPALVKVNALEGGELFRTELASSADVREAARRLARHGGVAAITRGLEPAVLCADGGGTWEGVPPARGSYPVGSGDSFMSGLLSARQRGLDWPLALALALGASAASAEVPVPAGFERARAEELAGQAKVVSV